MTERSTQKQAAQSNTQKAPEEWTTGDEPMTGAQRSYLKTLSEEAQQPFDPNLTKAQASQRIDELQRITGRGRAPRTSRPSDHKDDRIRTNAPETGRQPAEREGVEGGEPEADAQGGNVVGVSR